MSHLEDVTVETCVTIVTFSNVTLRRCFNYNEKKKDHIHAATTLDTPSNSMLFDQQALLLHIQPSLNNYQHNDKNKQLPL